MSLNMIPVAPPIPLTLETSNASNVQESLQTSETFTNLREQISLRCGTLLEETSTQDVESRKAYQYCLQIFGVEKTEKCRLISSYLPVTPVLQNGPRCGLVALAMASTLTNNQPVITEDIFKEAQTRGYSKQGEMFMAKDLQALAASFLNCPVHHCLVDSKDLFSNLLKHNLILIPYDADKNFSPCNKKGHKSHWALLTGFFAMLEANKVTDQLTSECVRDDEIHNLHYWPHTASQALCEETVQLLQENLESLYVFGHQGKSRYVGLWSLPRLIESNSNLTEAGQMRPSGEYVIPDGDIEQGLRGQMIVINRNQDT
nr:putative UPF0692 protein C19orf54 isoform X2 [Biomphalaria glabrata]